LHLVRPSTELLPLSSSFSTGVKHRHSLHTVESSSLAFECLTDITTGFTILPYPSLAPHGELRHTGAPFR
jgi:hypothetical protein